ncbi:MAG: undecaprenyldiphospho-muramoylpentapeptide beta-N-acetylglucosaminyltransferase [Clostridia bacterium]|nr:undecaprenyldiphospho-muramoylpentapeptide beta-N-acetylglucosaminyltransferase [Clostridia bacterium]MDD4047268.1 undecaprenyldiphospho-muramoylpentapeptide beta-N-acetylglucosaminyltransferase [Clostridia bacterium]
MRVILTGGGTGGHIYPAVAIGKAIQKEWSNSEILYVGTKSGLESKIVPEVGFPMATIDVIGWQRKISIQAIKAGWKAIKSFWDSRKLIRKYSPQLVIGTGGYVCLPVVWAAATLGIPTLIHEQNTMPGLTNKFLASRVNGVLLTFPESKKYFSAKLKNRLYVTGLPVRASILQIEREEGLKHLGFSSKKITLLGIGGSRGAKSINNAMLHVCKKFKGDPRLQILHITGQAGYSKFCTKLRKAGINVVENGNLIIKPYLNDMGYALACTDLCVGRAGATFLSEMTIKGIPGILVPYPYATENHQEYNARTLVKDGAAEIILDKEITGESLLEAIENIIFDEEKLKIMAEKSKKAGKPEAIREIIQIIKKFI